MNKKTKVTYEVFWCVKTMLKGGATYAEVAKYLGLATWTVGVIGRSESFDEYKNTIRARYTPVKKKNENPPKEKNDDNALGLQDEKMKGGTLSANYQMNRLLELIKAQNEILTILSNKVAFIVDELTK